MDGGKYYVKKKEDEANKFWQAMCQYWWETGNWPIHYHSSIACLSLVELKTIPVFNMFFDFEILICKEEWKEMVMSKEVNCHKADRNETLFPELEEYIHEIAQKNIFSDQKLFSGTNIGNMTLCLSPIRHTKKKLFVENWAYIIFPGLQVNFETALMIRGILVYTFLSEYQERNIRQGENPWTDVVDVSVYHNVKGLRTCGSCKSSRCKNKECRDIIYGKPTPEEKTRMDVEQTLIEYADMNNCPNSCSLGKIYLLHSVYWPYNVYTERGHQRVNLDINYHQVSEVLRKLTSIRSIKTEPTLGLEKKLQAPLVLDISEITSYVMKKRLFKEEIVIYDDFRKMVKDKYEKSKDSMIDNDQNLGLRNKETVVLDFNPGQIERIQQCIRDLMAMYNQIII